MPIAKQKVSGKELLQYGTVIKNNSFDTDRGYYTIRIVRYNNVLYFHKMLNGKQVELVKL